MPRDNNLPTVTLPVRREEMSQMLSAGAAVSKEWCALEGLGMNVSIGQHAVEVLAYLLVI